MKKRLLTTILIMSLTLMISCLSACSENEKTDETAGGGAGTETEEMTDETENGSDNEDAAPEKNEEEVINMTMKINDEVVNVTWENNESVKALMKMAAKEPVVVNMSMYGGFEQVGSLGTTLPSNDQNIKTKPGDIVLYTSDSIVVFYGNNSWAYTRLGHIEDKSKADQRRERMLQIFTDKNIVESLTNENALRCMAYDVLVYNTIINQQTK
jgi:hypothetical protein